MPDPTSTAMTDTSPTPNPNTTSTKAMTESAAVATASASAPTSVSTPTPTQTPTPTPIPTPTPTPTPTPATPVSSASDSSPPHTTTAAPSTSATAATAATTTTTTATASPSTAHLSRTFLSSSAPSMTFILHDTNEADFTPVATHSHSHGHTHSQIQPSVHVPISTPTHDHHRRNSSTDMSISLTPTAASGAGAGSGSTLASTSTVSLPASASASASASAAGPNGGAVPPTGDPMQSQRHGHGHGQGHTHGHGQEHGHGHPHAYASHEEMNGVISPRMPRSSSMPVTLRNGTHGHIHPDYMHAMTHPQVSPSHPHPHPHPHGHGHGHGHGHPPAHPPSHVVETYEPVHAPPPSPAHFPLSSPQHHHPTLTSPHLTSPHLLAPSTVTGTGISPSSSQLQRSPLHAWPRWHDQVLLDSTHTSPAHSHTSASSPSIRHTTAGHEHETFPSSHSWSESLNHASSNGSYARMQISHPSHSHPHSVPTEYHMEQSPQQRHTYLEESEHDYEHDSRHIQRSLPESHPQHHRSHTMYTRPIAGSSHDYNEAYHAHKRTKLSHDMASHIASPRLHLQIDDESEPITYHHGDIQHQNDRYRQRRHSMPEQFLRQAQAMAQGQMVPMTNMNMTMVGMSPSYSYEAMPSHHHRHGSSSGSSGHGHGMSPSPLEFSHSTPTTTRTLQLPPRSDKISPRPASPPRLQAQPPVRKMKPTTLHANLFSVGAWSYTLQQYHDLRHQGQQPPTSNSIATSPVAHSSASSSPLQFKIIYSYHKIVLEFTASLAGDKKKMEIPFDQLRGIQLDVSNEWTTQVAVDGNGTRPTHPLRATVLTLEIASPPAFFAGVQLPRHNPHWSPVCDFTDNQASTHRYFRIHLNNHTTAVKHIANLCAYDPKFQAMRQRRMIIDPNDLGYHNTYPAIKANTSNSPQVKSAAVPSHSWSTNTSYRRISSHQSPRDGSITSPIQSPTRRHSFSTAPYPQSRRRHSVSSLVHMDATGSVPSVLQSPTESSHRMSSPHSTISSTHPSPRGNGYIPSQPPPPYSAEPVTMPGYRGYQPPPLPFPLPTMFQAPGTSNDGNDTAHIKSEVSTEHGYQSSPPESRSYVPPPLPVGIDPQAHPQSYPLPQLQLNTKSDPNKTAPVSTVAMIIRTSPPTGICRCDGGCHIQDETSGEHHCICFTRCRPCGTPNDDGTPSSCHCPGNCQQPFTLLAQHGIIFPSPAHVDPCLVDALLYDTDVASLLAQQVLYTCCNLYTTVGTILRNIASASSPLAATSAFDCRHCEKQYLYSFCLRQLCSQGYLPRHHCSKCRSCGDHRNRHCDACKRCYLAGAQGQYTCPCKQQQGGQPMFTPGQVQVQVRQGLPPTPPTSTSSPHGLVPSSRTTMVNPAVQGSYPPVRSPASVHPLPPISGHSSGSYPPGTSSSSSSQAYGRTQPYTPPMSPHVAQAATFSSQVSQPTPPLKAQTATAPVTPLPMPLPSPTAPHSTSTQPSTQSSQQQQQQQHPSHMPAAAATPTVASIQRSHVPDSPSVNPDGNGDLHDRLAQTKITSPPKETHTINPRPGVATVSRPVERLEMPAICPTPSPPPPTRSATTTGHASPSSYMSLAGDQAVDSDATPPEISSDHSTPQSKSSDAPSTGSPSTGSFTSPIQMPTPSPSPTPHPTTTSMSNSLPTATSTFDIDVFHGSDMYKEHRNDMDMITSPLHGVVPMTISPTPLSTLSTSTSCSSTLASYDNLRVVQVTLPMQHDKSPAPFHQMPPQAHQHPLFHPSMKSHPSTRDPDTDPDSQHGLASEMYREDPFRAQRAVPSTNADTSH